jgi:hypothetical protein
LPQRVVLQNKAYDSREDDSITSDEEAIRGPGSSRHAAKSTGREFENDGFESEDIVAPSPRKRRKRDPEAEILQTPRSRSEQDKLDLEEDLEDLRDSGSRFGFDSFRITN